MCFASRSSAPCKDVGGGVRIDHRLAPGAAYIGGDQRALDRRGRQPLVPQRDGKFGQLRKVAGEGAGRLRARSFRAVHVDRQPEHDAGGAPLGGKIEDAPGIEVETPRA